MMIKSRYNKRIRSLACVIDVFSKYVWVVPLKDEKFLTITTNFDVDVNT